MSHRVLRPDESADRVQLYRHFKEHTNIAIYGSFQQSRKRDLLALREYLRANGYLNARISEDYSERLDPGTEDGPIKDIKLSDLLMDEGSIHIFVFVKENQDEHYLIQSVSMEFQRLSTLMQHGIKEDQPAAIYIEEGLEKIAGGVFKGRIAQNEHGWDIDFFKNIEQIYKPARRFCERSLAELYGF
ncbi:hypothetical protein F8E02_01395 [Methanoculleus sp. Wushi-C6]|uniref:Uncharacterized protein n=1 Tax=Methanoculleus caldifontis TaxID=2651577 RepID=A0ABU3WXZ9_9EURY|nr:hypothetical protein [Methanoculleus sp. Wushi-C6]MDV2480683.1 hypothetical protein [Methanoculleus sp. Wushi-C6]